MWENGVKYLYQPLPRRTFLRISFLSRPQVLVTTTREKKVVHPASVATGADPCSFTMFQTATFTATCKMNLDHSVFVFDAVPQVVNLRLVSLRELQSGNDTTYSCCKESFVQNAFPIRYTSFFTG